MSSGLVEFVEGFPFPLDDYQIEACTHLDQGSGVLVAAPTGAGKTVVGEYGVWLALTENRKCFYTTPIKALSNQKFHDLREKYGVKNVGLLTGDQSINSEAPIVVMTTEVLRNMIYAKSATLTGLGYVVMDEVHYLADKFRGPVWEEVILGLADSVTLIALSATVSNAEEFGEWLDEVRGGVKVVVSEKRPVPLYQHIMAGKRIYDLYNEKDEPNPELTRLARAEARRNRDDARRPRGASGKGRRTVKYGSGRYGGATSKRFQDKYNRNEPHRSLTPSRGQTVRTLERVNFLPAIVFVFSRAGCDGAVRQLIKADVNLVSPNEARQLAEIADQHLGQMSPTDLAAIGYETFFDGLIRGVAAHHAGLLPAFKAVVEEGFEAGLLKVVFATETLALGINMPAKSVVIERLVKYNGEAHVDITPGEFTQLTGRAGRRGIDTEGHAVVLWRDGLDPRAVAGLASRRTYPLISSFAPSYNMAINMVQTVGRDRALSLLEQSFAQFQTDKSVVASARRVAKDAEAIKDYLEAAKCELGDFTEYAELREEINQLETEQAKARKLDLSAEVIDSLSALTPGDVIWVPSGKNEGWAAVINTGRPPEPHPLVMTIRHQMARLSLRDFPVPVRPISKIRVPKKFDSKVKSDRKQLFNALVRRLDELQPEVPDVRRPGVPKELAEEISRLRSELREHPCHACPDRESHARFAEQAMRLIRQADQKQEAVAKRRNSIGTKFERICAVLTSLGYLDAESDTVTKDGQLLARIYCELDLVVAECLRDFVFDGLTAPELAAVLSSLVYESRVNDGRVVRMPNLASERAQSKVRETWHRVGQVERDFRVDRPAPPDIGFAEAAFDWASGRPLGAILAENEMPAGDFVRWVRQVIDLALQISRAVGPGDLSRACLEINSTMRRGVIDFDPDFIDEDDVAVFEDEDVFEDQWPSDFQTISPEG